MLDPSTKIDAIGKVEFLVLPPNNLFISYRAGFTRFHRSKRHVSIDGPDEILINNL